MSVDALADGLLLRLGKREGGAQDKARVYLLEGRLQIRSVGQGSVAATCRGQGHLYEVSYEAHQGWRCSCPAKSRCAHIIAVQLVVIAPGDSRIPPGGFGK